MGVESLGHCLPTTVPLLTLIASVFSCEKLKKDDVSAAVESGKWQVDPTHGCGLIASKDADS